MENSLTKLENICDNQYDYIISNTGKITEICDLDGAEWDDSKK
jgi:hypothetical protein